MISVNWNTNATAKPVGGSCSTPTGSNSEFIPGPISGSVTIRAYVFDNKSTTKNNTTDLWLGSRCITKASASQTNILKYDGKTSKYWIIPSSINSGSISGDPIDGLSLSNTCADVVTTQMSLLTGSATIVSSLGTDVGHGLKFTEGFFPVTFPDLGSYEVLGQGGCYLSSFSLEIDYPNVPAQASYSWQFILDCEGGSAPPKGKGKG
ncbi:MAG: hypothetical protein DRQ39_07600 [Gammaproteobacteria bacterium]|nr:MAG: hypothetical protein DRQ39_07600 [Gammaproteobacteria bacterium]RKZ96633.1 MAG: hypothetical protein DRQ40_00545 [Gammaproteobacteria bacterium]